MKFKNVLLWLLGMTAISLYTHSVGLTIFMGVVLLGIVQLAREEYDRKRYGFPDIDPDEIRYGASPDYLSYNRDKDYLDEA